MRSRCARAVVFVCLGLSVFVVRPAAAAPAPREARATQAQQAITRMIERQLVRPLDPRVVQAEARRILQALTEEQISSLLAGGKLTATLPNSRYTVKIAGDQLSIAPAAPAGTTALAAAATLGDAQSDLLFVPVTPCRVIDTRLAGGPIAANATRAFVVTGTANFEAQGGKSGGCGIPQGASTPEAAAVAFDFVAVGPQGPGDLRAWPFGQPKPLAGILSYTNVPGLNIANGIVVPIAGVSTQADDLNIATDVSGTHVVADVTGYFTRFPVEQFQGSLKTTVAESDDSTLTDLGSGSCIQVNSCTITAAASGKVVVTAWVGVVADHTQGTADKVAFGFETAAPVTCGWQADSANTSVMTASAGLGTNADYDMTLSHGATFPIAAGVTQTYYLSIQWLAGAGSGDQYENSRLICSFIPN